MEMKMTNGYEKVKESLFVRMRSKSVLEHLPEEVVHTMVEDMVVTYHIQTDLPGADIVITNYVLQEFGISKEQLHEDAISNSIVMKPATINSMSTTLFGLAGNPFCPDEISPNILVVTNKQMTDGAAALLYPGIKPRLYSMLGGSYYILPSSRHEVLALPCGEHIDASELREMVQDINRTVVDEEDQLSDNVYIYDGKKFKIA